MPKLLVLRDLVIYAKNRATRNLEWRLWSFLMILCGVLLVLMIPYVANICLVVAIALPLPLVVRVYIIVTTTISALVLQTGLSRLVDMFTEMAKYVGYKK